jgi:hypothetical protein
MYIRDYFPLLLSSVVLNSSLLPDSLVFPTPRSVHMVYGRDITSLTLSYGSMS